VILPLSGANAQFGINSRQGIELVVDEINSAGGLKNLAWRTCQRCWAASG
jgi:branched-chain amino acid transport system substrate-binding protein